MLKYKHVNILKIQETLKKGRIYIILTYRK